MSSPYTIGIDLGTSNCALAYIDTREADKTPRLLQVVQMEDAQAVSESAILPSCLYYPLESELKSLPQDAVFRLDEQTPQVVLGRFALHQAGRLPGRGIRSAKSWLCHPGVDRNGPILPWHSEDVDPSRRMSPVVASAHYLARLREAWNTRMAAGNPEHEFERQDVTITVPASFDEAAQRLTFEAARRAGFPSRLRLLEEPQAAFYHWLDRNGQGRALLEQLPDLRETAQTVLICDIGGGTSDFSLFSIDPLPSEDRIPGIRRIEVSDHLLLGGDNMDLALAHRLEEKLAAGPGTLGASQWAYLVAEARRLKERALDPARDASEPEVLQVSIPGSGAGLFAGTLTASLSTDEINEVLIEGFFPGCERNEKPFRAPSGLKEIGLPYAADPAITKHVAAFLRERPVDAVLYTGGTLKPERLQQTLTGTISSWQPERPPKTLRNDDPDLAVARGAAVYGNVLREPFGRIAGGYPHSLYLEIQTKGKQRGSKLVCILPKGFEENQTIRIENLNLKLLVGKPVRFQLYYSTLRSRDNVGDVIDFTGDTFTSLPALQTGITLQPGLKKPPDGRLPVVLETSLNELGLLQIACVHPASEENTFRWELEFDLRRTDRDDDAEASKQRMETGTDEALAERARERIAEGYAKKRREDPNEKPRNLVRELESILGRKRDEWDLGLLRSLWPALVAGMTRKNRSPEHEAAWLNLAGYVLRPGYGSELDPFRIEELWRLQELKLAFPKELRVLTQWWILWRRVAGGLDRERQEIIMRPLLMLFRNKKAGSAEVFRLAGSLERVGHETKEELVKWNLRFLKEKRVPPADPIWSLGRLLNRAPLYAGPDAVPAPRIVEESFEKLKDLDWSAPRNQGYNEAFARACRVTGLRENDVSDELRTAVLDKMTRSGASEKQLRVVTEYVPLEETDQANLFGESLPPGLILY